MYRIQPISLCSRLVLPALVLVFMAGVLAPRTAWAEGDRDAKADAIADRTLEAMGGAEAWEKSRFFRFTFAGFRTHHWDKYTGRHRLEFKSRDGDHFVMLSNVQTQEGSAYKNGEALAGEELSQALEQAYGAWINDTYWLLMPYKLKDPGVLLTYEGEETVDGQACDKLHLTFESVGLTPQDRYWAFIDRESGLMKRWAYHLQGWEEEREPTAWDWSDWSRHGGILLASGRSLVGGDRSLPLADIAVPETMADEIFTSSEPRLEGE